MRRGADNLPAITPDTVLQHGDAVVVLGPEKRLADAAAMFQAPCATPTTQGSTGGAFGATVDRSATSPDDALEPRA